jgi:gluconokinase
MDASDAASVDASEAEDPLVLALDVGTSSVRALVYDGVARAVRGWEVHEPYEVTTTADGGVVIDPDILVRLCEDCLDSLLAAAGRQARRLTAVACDTFWHSLMGLSADGEPLTPVLTWADTRSHQAARELHGRLDGAAIRARTGSEIHSSYWPAKLVWLSGADWSTYARVRSWVSFAEYLCLRLFGELRVSISMASGTGIFDQHSCDWDLLTIDQLPIQRDQLSPVAEFSDVFRELRSRYRPRWPALARLPWYLAIGDGAANNLGSGGTRADCVVVMVGTSGALRVVREAVDFENPRGLWTYHVDRRRIIQGGALSAGGNIYAWARETLAVGDRAALEREVAAMAPDSHGLTVLPFLAGERSPDWNVDARSAIEGVTLHTTPAAIVRALLEAITYRFALVQDIVEREIPKARNIIGSGAALLNSPFWTQLLADVLERPVAMSAVPEASTRGAALLVLESLGAVEDITKAKAPVGAVFEAIRGNVTAYRAAMKRQQELYERLLGGKLSGQESVRG